MYIAAVRMVPDEKGEPEITELLFKDISNDFYTTQYTIQYLLTYEAERFLRRCQLCRLSGTSQQFKEPGGSSPCSQEPSTGPFPEPDQSSP
jgi:hypothetical protein